MLRCPQRKLDSGGDKQFRGRRIAACFWRPKSDAELGAQTVSQLGIQICLGFRIGHSVHVLVVRVRRLVAGTAVRRSAAREGEGRSDEEEEQCGLETETLEHSDHVHVRCYWFLCCGARIQRQTGLPSARRLATGSIRASRKHYVAGGRIPLLNQWDGRAAVRRSASDSLASLSMASNTAAVRGPEMRRRRLPCGSINT